ncbi:general stress protein [Blastomonas fulva]|jgi:hypothetical protein|uniref:general stress protein n=1 Tax=Blastomonas fulva TaxID=1550728 RepID=UPI003D28BA66
MSSTFTAVAVFDDHSRAEAAITQLGKAGFAMKNLSIVGKGYHTDEKVVGFYTKGDRIKFWGKQGAFWGGMWGLFLGGVFIAIPVIGHVMVLGYLAATAIAAAEGAIVVGGAGALAAALYGLGIKKDSVVRYEVDITADHFLVMAHGTETEAERAKDLLTKAHATRVEVYSAEAMHEKVLAE